VVVTSLLNGTSLILPDWWISMQGCGEEPGEALHVQAAPPLKSLRTNFVTFSDVCVCALFHFKGYDRNRRVKIFVPTRCPPLSILREEKSQGCEKELPVHFDRKVDH